MTQGLVSSAIRRAGLFHAWVSMPGTYYVGFLKAAFLYVILGCQYLACVGKRGGKKFQMKKSLVLIACASAALVLGGCAGTTTAGSSAGNSNSSSPKESTVASSAPTEETVASNSDASFKDGVLTTSDIKIEITDHKIIPVGAKGNEYGKKPVIAFWYKTTNVAGKDVSPMNFLFNITAYQDNNPNAENKLDVAGLPDNSFLSSQTEKIKKGGTVANAVAYELDDATTPVDLVASNDLGMSEIGKVTYNLK